MQMNLAGACGCTWMLAMCLALASGACVSPDTFPRDEDAGPGAGGSSNASGGSNGSGSGGSAGTGAGGSTGGGTGGHTTTGTGGTTGVGGHTGVGGSVVGPTANFMDDFESGDVTTRWISDPNPGLRSSSSPGCGDWAVVTDTTLASNHAYENRATCSNPSWTAGGNTAWTDMRLRARVLFGAGATATTIVSLAVRFIDDRSQYFIEFSNDGKLKIRAKVEAGGASSDISNGSKARVPVPAGQWTTIGLSVSGATANIYLGDDPTAAPVLSGPVAGITAGGIALGVQGGPAYFDDVVVTPP